MKAPIGWMLVIAACGRAPTAPSARHDLAAKSVPLPGATGPVSVDLIAYDPARARVWVPVGDTGSVDVFEIRTGRFARVDGFETATREVRGRTRTMGPSAAAIGEGVAYVADRATGVVCAVDEATLKRGECLALPTPADFLIYVPATKELWATTPRSDSIAVLDARSPGELKPKAMIRAPGSVEGAALDAVHGIFYTNLEDKNQTLAIDVGSHAIRSTWSAGCTDSPHGVAVDSARELVMVACSDGIHVRDGAHDGATLGALDTGAGVDDVYFDPAPRLLYVAASSAQRLTIARIGEHGKPSVVATGALAGRARNAVADASGNVYVVDAEGARLLVFGAPAVAE